MAPPLQNSFSMLQKTLKYIHLLILYATGAVSALSTIGCFVKSACFSDADCSEGRTCVIAQGATGGTCREMCFEDRDCKEGYLCEPTSHLCREVECRRDENCREGFECVAGRCRAKGALICPEGMVPIHQRFCIDVYEASKPDATSENPGVDGSMATSRPGVLPWQVASNQEADRACRAADKSLCSEEEWQAACMGPDTTDYAYGNKYDPTICNGIDTFCYCDEGSCSGADPCPFEACFSECGAAYHLEPTGTFQDCTNGFGVFDINGNLWEHVLGGDETRIRGGAYNCIDSARLHRCDYIPGDWEPLARGFRCCASGYIEGGGDAGAEEEGAE
jgi:hypothetical protein